MNNNNNNNNDDDVEREISVTEDASRYSDVNGIATILIAHDCS